MAKRHSFHSIIRDSAYYERLGMQVELERLQKQADDIRLQLRAYPAHILERAQIAGIGETRRGRSIARTGGGRLRPGTRRMSAAARKRISDAQKARWAKHRATRGQAAPGATEATRGRRAGAAKRGGRKRTLSPEARKRIADAQKRRWAKYRKQKG